MMGFKLMMRIIFHRMEADDVDIERFWRSIPLDGGGARFKNLRLEVLR